MYYDFSHGVDLRPVEVVRIRKSVGCENTFEKDLTTHTALIIELWHVADELIRRFRESRIQRTYVDAENQIPRFYTEDP